jgi:hypothetical protein
MGAMSHERLFDLILLATGDREMAEREAKALINAQIRPGDSAGDS